VVVGDTVKWIWLSGSHTTTATSIPGAAASWDSPISSPSALSYSYKVTTAGAYSYICSFHSNMVGSFTASAAAGIRTNPAFLLSVTTYPNPVKNALSLDIQSASTSTVQLALYNVLGKMLSSQNLVLSAGLNQFNPDLSGLAKGLYILSLTQEGRQIAVKKITKE
jgi:hypothetical protein